MEQQYLNLLRDVRRYGIDSNDRTNTGTSRVFGRQMRADQVDLFFPLMTTKRVFFKGVFHELMWMLQGLNETQYLKDRGVNIWNDWELPDGTIGPGYGVQWRAWNCSDGSTIDQIAQVQRDIRQNPESRRLLVSAWNVEKLPEMALAPCHCFFQFAVLNNVLSLQVYIRSNDAFLGAPFNMAQYALLLCLMAKTCDLYVGELIYTVGDFHIYNNHVNQVDEQLERTPFDLPSLRVINKRENVWEYQFEDVELCDYKCHPPIKAPIAV